MKICKIKDDYIEYLQQFDPSIEYNKKEKRPYIGVLFDKNGLQYFAPLSSPKPKHEHMKDSLDFFKIEGNRLGVIKLNNMIPVIPSVIIKYDISKEPDLKYRNLLYDQSRQINKYSNTIQSNAEKLYEKVTVYNSYLSKRCCNYKLLESVCIRYQKGFVHAADNAMKIPKTKMGDRFKAAKERSEARSRIPSKNVSNKELGRD